jgi:hypothetical protein
VCSRDIRSQTSLFTTNILLLKCGFYWLLRHFFHSHTQLGLDGIAGGSVHSLGDLVAFQNSRCAPKLSCVHIPLLCQPKIRGQASASWKICQQGKALDRGGNMLVFMVTLFALQGKTNFLAPLWQFPPFDRRLETCSSRPSAPLTVTPW